MGLLEKIKKELTSVKNVLREKKKGYFNPLISSLGVNVDVNIVNIQKTPLYFHSRHEYLRTPTTLV